MDVYKYCISYSWVGLHREGSRRDSILLLVKRDPERREVTSSHGRQRGVPAMEIAPGQETWPMRPPAKSLRFMQGIGVVRVARSSGPICRWSTVPRGRSMPVSWQLWAHGSRGA